MRRAAAFLAACLLAAPAAAQEARPERVKVEYGPSAEPAHAEIVQRLRARGALEKIEKVLSPLRLPRPLTIRLAGCDGDENAWYDGAAVTICYEYIEWVERVAAKSTPDAAASAVMGPFYNVVFHETAHAVFDYLQIPILGREEDAADQLAALLIMALAPDDADRLVDGIVALHLDDGGYRSLKQLGRRRLRFRSAAVMAEEHGAPEQRLYNLLCLAYGADAQRFRGFVDKGTLPAERAEGCSAEYRQVVHAYVALIQPHLDPDLARKVYGPGWPLIRR